MSFRRSRLRALRHLTILAAVAGALALPLPADAAVPATPTFTTAVDDYPPAKKPICPAQQPSQARPGVLAFVDMIQTANPGAGANVSLVRPCDPDRRPSDHWEGRAWDYGLVITQPSDVALADEIMTWLIETVGGAPHMRARRLGIRYVIWNNRMYVFDDPGAAWTNYEGCSGGWTGDWNDTNCHRDHMHFSFSDAGADQQTTWWTGSTGTPQQTVPTNWVLTNYNQGSTAAWNSSYGDSSSWPVVGDWDGSGSDTIGQVSPDDVWRWALIDTNSGGSPSHPKFGYGSINCTPLTGDWDGDGDTTPGVACKNGTQWQWALVDSLGGSPSHLFNYGSSNCKPVTGNWDGIGGDTVGVVCGGTTSWTWSLINSLSGGSASYQAFGFGSLGCAPVSGDWDGNGSDTVGAACVDNGQFGWNLRNGNSAGGLSVPYFRFGTSTGKRPIVGDWNGDGTTTVGTVTKPNDWA